MDPSASISALTAFTVSHVRGSANSRPETSAVASVCYQVWTTSFGRTSAIRRKSFSFRVATSYPPRSAVAAIRLSASMRRVFPVRASAPPDLRGEVPRILVDFDHREVHQKQLASVRFYRFDRTCVDTAPE